MAGQEGIRQYNPQRHDMELLTAIVLEDVNRGVIVGYLDTSPDDFWVRGHMPGMPLLPGVLMCEAAAQLASYYVQKYDVMGAEMMGFGGLEEVRFRGTVRPGDRLVIQCKQIRVRRGALVICQFQGYVDQNLVVGGQIRGIPLPADALRAADANG
ncbi:MAG: beta-hydroxyacyl-ACP dehydratase [Planctomycetales bacterium]|nr:beta-hydroxyacyl-ACP dehydratase [Planctomycetales bacterium]NIM08561.1 beta-hydroxyacyl-ACP dehydratase [Planctomycetales bacterium]NIN08032.1 beta-hydroxyacyl-ACP dehydratase [Planctomycetales bacterium]NIN77168.1 beta-hydroxyacyl-ACP dehydratase [Planctomycetales bacterium]NIO34350.1 beta-hydroxyacyl-ACP dehydratase [Planctomycetales bacterium]